jgi:DNA repair protein RadC
MDDNPRLPKYRISLVRESSIQYEGALTNPVLVFDMMKNFYQDVDREMLIAITLDSKNKAIGMNIVSVGSLSESVAHPREIIKLAVLQNAAAMILIHNHPSGNPYPSSQDDSMTKRMGSACELLGIRLLDSIIIGEKDFFSYQNSGRM